MTIEDLLTEVTDSKLSHLKGFDKTDCRLKSLAEYLNKKYSPDLIWDPVLIAGKLFELEETANIMITKELIDKSVENFQNSNPPYQKQLEYFIISVKHIDDDDEFNSDLLTFYELE